jgi:hypothetical protein
MTLLLWSRGLLLGVVVLFAFVLLWAAATSRE